MQGVFLLKDLHTFSTARFPKSSLHPHRVCLHTGYSSSGTPVLPPPPPPPAPPRHDRVLPPVQRSVWAHCGCSHTGVRSCSADRGETPRSAEERDTVGCLFWSELLGISGADLKPVRERRTTCRVSMASLVNSACLLFLPVALLLSKYRDI